MKTYKIFDVIGLLFSLASLVTVFMIVPPLYLAPLGLIFSITSAIKSKDKKLAKIGIAISIISLLIVAGLYWFWNGVQIAP